MRFVDPYYQQGSTKKYQSSDPFYQTGPVTGPFYNIITSDPQPVIAFSSEVTNTNCETPETQSLSETVTSSSSDTWSLTTTVDVSNAASITIGVPDIGGEPWRNWL